MVAKKSNTGNKKPVRKKKKAKSQTGLYIILALIVGFPVIGLVSWYVITAVLSVSGSDLSAREMIAFGIENVETALQNEALNRSRTEGFSLGEVERCQGITGQYQNNGGEMSEERLVRTLIGLPGSASETEVYERCVLFAKVVKRMEKLAHHNRHLYMCGAAEFSADESQRFRIMPDPRGRGLIESMPGRKALIPIPKGTHKLIRQWQVFNMGGGCLIIGISSNGKFRLS